MPYEYSTEEMIELTYEVLQKIILQDAYLRPLMYMLLQT